jgi:hypothetical protein
MSIRQAPHFKLSSQVLADWLDRQNAVSWWSVDGDPFLTERLHFPCPSDELATELRRIDRPLLVLATGSQQVANQRELEEGELDQLAKVDNLRDRAFQLCWEDADPEIDWVLSEDVEVGERSSTSSGA